MASQPTRAEIETFMNITGASESLARLTLQEHGGNVNEAVNAHFSGIDPYRTNSASVFLTRNDSLNTNDQTQRGQRGGLLPILSAVRSFRPSLLLNPNYRRNLFNWPGTSPPTASAPHIPRPTHTGEMPYDYWGMNQPYDHSRTTANTDNVYGTFSPHNSETHDRFNNQDVEEDMIKAAIEASRKEVSSEVSHGQVHLDDDDVARALSLSMKTAEEEKAAREMLMKADNIRQKVDQGAETSYRSGIEGLQIKRAKPGSSLVQDSVDIVPEHPLLTQKSDTQVHPHTRQAGFNSDEWGGLSPIELDEAVMLEAATFGQNPGSTSNFIPNAGHVSSGPHIVPSHPIPCSPSPSLTDHRLLREQQDSEYLASLLADQDKASATRKKAVNLCSKDEEYKLEKENLDRIIARKEASLPQEPQPENQNAITLLVRMPDGSRHDRRFLISDKLKGLFDFIDVCRVVKPDTYRVVRSFPRRAFSPSDGSLSFSDVGLTSKQEALFLELTSSEIHD